VVGLFEYWNPKKTFGRTPIDKRKSELGNPKSTLLEFAHPFKLELMNSDLRTHIELNRRETIVLKYLFQGLTSKQISKKTKIAIHFVNAARQLLLKKFQARTTIHLIAIASTDHANFLMLDVKVSRPYSEIDATMTSIILLILQGFQHKEISNQLNLSVREVEYRRSKFVRVAAIQNPADFVKKCFEHGLFVTTPFCYHPSFKNVYGVRTKILSLEASNFPKCFNYSQLNHTGFLYLDFQNRFQYEFNSSLNTTDSIRILVKLMHISDVPRSAVATFVGLSTINWEHEFNYDPFNNAVMRLEGLKHLVNSPHFRWNIQIAQSHTIQTMVQLVIIEYLVQKNTEDEVLKLLNISQSEFRQHIQKALESWHCKSLIGLLVTFVHLNFFASKNLT